MKLFLFDGSALVFRSFHAFRGRVRITSRGLDVGMLYGFMTTLMMVLRREKPDRLAIAFDTSAPTFRHKIFTEYKAQRPPLDEGIRAQLPLLHNLLSALNIPQLSKEGWEADDLIGTLAKMGSAKNMDVYIVSGDKDFLQLVDDKVKVYRLPHGRVTDAAEVVDVKGVYERFGVSPQLVVDILSLMGDAIDNVPGIPKVGEKTAIELIQRFGSLDETLNRADEIEKPALRANLKEFAQQARLSRDLIIIDTNAPLEITPDDLRYGPLNNPAARKMLREWEFSSILKQIETLEPFAEIVDVGLDAKGTAEIGQKQMQFYEESKPGYKAVTNPADLMTLIERLKQADLISLDIETTSTEAMRAEIVGLSFSIREGEAWYIATNYFTDVPQDFIKPPSPRLRPNCSPELAYVLESLKPVLTNSQIKKCGQNLKYDFLVLKCYDIEVQGLDFDAMLASYTLDPAARQHGIDALAEIYLGYRKIPTSQLIGSGSKQISMSLVPLEQITEYACEDADIALRLTNFFRPKLAQESLERLYDRIELPLMPVLLDMEYTGIKLDLELLKDLSVEFQDEMDELMAQIYNLAGVRFNLNSTQQLAEVLYNKLGLPVGRKTKFGYSTDIDELERLATLHEVPAKLLRYRHLAKLKSTYIDALPQLVHPITKRVHTSFSQTTAATGRLASTDPNLQNIPVRTDEGGRIRKAFIAGEAGWKILSADYSQIELRIMAHLAQDERMLKAFTSGMDIHRATAAWMNGISPEEVTPEMRRAAKEVNFGVLYGMGDFGLAQRLGISRARAKEFIDNYFANFAKVKLFIEKLHQTAREKEYVETILGRRRALPDINNKNFNIRSNAERIAINTPIQGSAADLMKIAMIKVHRTLKDHRFKARMLLQVHDELLFEVPPEEVDSLGRCLKETMSTAMTLSVPLEVGIGVGDNWLDAH